jgi:hypothetical protein
MLKNRSFIFVSLCVVTENALSFRRSLPRIGCARGDGIAWQDELFKYKIGMLRSVVAAALPRGVDEYEDTLCDPTPPN